MVTPAFGWSAGDIVNSIYLIIKICEAFKEAGGATSRYEDNAVFLEGFRATLTKLDSHIRLNPNPEYAAEISQHLKLIDAPYCRFEKFMLKFQPALSSTSTYGRVRKVPKKIQWALTELSTASSKVTELKREVCDPLTLLENVLQLQSIEMLQNISAQVSKLPESGQIETWMVSVKDTTENSVIAIKSHINDLMNQSAQGHEKQLAAPADRKMAKGESYPESNPRTAWFGQLASQAISTGINSAITGAIPSSVSMTAIKLTLKLPRR